MWEKHTDTKAGGEKSLLSRTPQLVATFVELQNWQKKKKSQGINGGINYFEISYWDK